jgi:hypothetical protein
MPVGPSFVAVAPSMAGLRAVRETARRPFLRAAHAAQTYETGVSRSEAGLAATRGKRLCDHEPLRLAGPHLFARPANRDASRCFSDGPLGVCSSGIPQVRYGDDPPPESERRPPDRCTSVPTTMGDYRVAFDRRVLGATGATSRSSTSTINISLRRARIRTEPAAHNSRRRHPRGHLRSAGRGHSHTAL